jgi:hypothetical protein
MIMALIAPELIVTWALRQWFSVREVTRQFNLKDSGYPNVHLEQPETEGELCFQKLCISQLTLHILRKGVGSS